MRNIPVDAAKIVLIATGKARPKPEYVKLADGSSRKTGAQATQDGVPMWLVDVVPDEDDDDSRSEAYAVVVVSHTQPQPPKFQQVTFENLVASSYLPKGARYPVWTFEATGIVNRAAKAAA
jgi:hypothetical protein